MATFTGTAREKQAAKLSRWNVAVALALCLTLSVARADERPTFPEETADTFEILPYQSAGYKFAITSPDSVPPDGFEQPDFDDSVFADGDGAFGSGGDCPLQPAVETDWPINSELLIRRVVSIPAGATNLRVMVSIDNDILGVFFNGTPIADFTAHDDCPILDEFRFDVPPELIEPGENLVAFHVSDRGDESFFDTRILADLAPAQLVGQLNEAVVIERAPLVPVSDVAAGSDFDASAERSDTTISYIIAGTGELGEIRIGQANADTFTVEFLLDGEQMALGTITSEEMTVLRSLQAIERLADLDPGILSAISALADQSALEVVFRAIQVPAASCQTTCDQKAAREAVIAAIMAEFAKSAGGVALRREGPLTTDGAKFGSSLLAAGGESIVLSRIERRRQQCLAECPAPVPDPLAPPINPTPQPRPAPETTGSLTNTVQFNAPPSTTTGRDPFQQDVIFDGDFVSGPGTSGDTTFSRRITGQVQVGSNRTIMLVVHNLRRGNWRVTASIPGFLLPGVDRPAVARCPAFVPGRVRFNFTVTSPPPGMVARCEMR